MGVSKQVFEALLDFDLSCNDADSQTLFPHNTQALDEVVGFS